MHVCAETESGFIGSVKMNSFVWDCVLLRVHVENTYMMLSHKCVQTSCKLPAETQLLWQHHHGDSNLTVFEEKKAGSDPAADVWDHKDFRERKFTPMSFISCATDLVTFFLMNPVNADPAARHVHQSPTYCVRGIDGSLPGCKGENWRSLAPITP